jgi:uncharacterized cupredoxin-like copper-binding protein
LVAADKFERITGMATIKYYATALAASLAFALPVGGASAATVVNVELWDKGNDVPMGTNMAFDTPSLDMSKATMGTKAIPAKAPAGVVTFHVKNSSKDTVHELIVMYLVDPTKPLPYVDKDSKVDEAKTADKGEVSELQPGKSGSLTVVLKPGKYLLICDVAGHFAAGMWSEFEVTK